MKIGMALGSGSARGRAHIGVLDALGEAGIHADIVAPELQSLLRD